MRLTACLLKKVLPKGHMWIGKTRLEFKPKPFQKAQFLTDLLIEEKNMLYLRHPFLSYAQSRGHARELQLGRKYMEEVKNKRKQWWEPVRFEDRLNHLRHTEKWDD